MNELDVLKVYCLYDLSVHNIMKNVKEGISVLLMLHHICRSTMHMSSPGDHSCVAKLDKHLNYMSLFVMCVCVCVCVYRRPFCILTLDMQISAVF